MHAFGSAPCLEIRGKGVYPPSTHTPHIPNFLVRGQGRANPWAAHQNPTILPRKPRRRSDACKRPRLQKTLDISAVQSTCSCIDTSIVLNWHVRRWSIPTGTPIVKGLMACQRCYHWLTLICLFQLFVSTNGLLVRTRQNKCRNNLWLDGAGILHCHCCF